MIRLILLTLLLVSCALPQYERRVGCDNGFYTPWSLNEYAYTTDGGTVRWSDEWDEWATYRIPGGVTCSKEKRIVK